VCTELSCDYSHKDNPVALRPKIAEAKIGVFCTFYGIESNTVILVLLDGGFSPTWTTSECSLLLISSSSTRHLNIIGSNRRTIFFCQSRKGMLLKRIINYCKSHIHGIIISLSNYCKPTNVWHDEADTFTLYILL
jgi:hypothetical protein